MNPFLSLFGKGLYAAAGMFWSIFWALMLGFMLSGIVQTFVSKKRMAALLGGSGLKELGLASFFGAASSSCSYAAASMTRSLFQKGVHIIPALAFMLASTNLVIELSVILWAVLGWQFVVAEFVGGFFLVAIMAVLMRLFGPLKDFDKKREDLNRQANVQDEPEEEAASALTLEGWRAAAQAFVMEWQMIWKDISLGMLISGFLMVLVPDRFWQALFLRNTAADSFTLLRVIENALVGPLVAVFSFVCSVGNIPLAGVLYHGGIRFGGAISFIYADLIIIPLILIYRKYYGWKLALWITGIFYASMVLSGILVDAAFSTLGLVPNSAMAPMTDEMHFFRDEYTFWLNLAFLAMAIGMVRLAKNGKPRHSSCCSS